MAHWKVYNFAGISLYVTDTKLVHEWWYYVWNGFCRCLLKAHVKWNNIYTREFSNFLVCIMDPLESAVPNKTVILWASQFSVIFSLAIKHIGNWQGLSMRDQMTTCSPTSYHLYKVKTSGNYVKIWTHRKCAVCSVRKTSRAN